MALDDVLLLLIVASSLASASLAWRINQLQQRVTKLENRRERGQLR